MQSLQIELALNMDYRYFLNVHCDFSHHSAMFFRNAVMVLYIWDTNSYVEWLALVH